MFQRLSLLLVTAGLLVLAGCDTPQTPASAAPPSLVGYWKSAEGDGFEVTTTTFTQYNWGSKTIWFQGTIVGSSPVTDPSGSITLFITARGNFGPAIGRYFVIRWKSLTEKGVMQSTAYKKNGLEDAETKAVAEGEFTEANGYFGGFGVYARQ